MCGLPGPDDRKSPQPIAKRLGLAGYGQLQHFISSPPSDDAPLWTELTRLEHRPISLQRSSLSGIALH
ncbi:hypothetical protein DK412_14810 [Methylobacterium sp. 17Sr1-1]|nr:hypothetical protein DK412_14810 [Methylobacterium sp. 17Sr1-1]